MIGTIGQRERLIICIFLLLVIAFITRLNILNDKIEVNETVYSVSGGMIQNGHVCIETSGIMLPL